MKFGNLKKSRDKNKIIFVFFFFNRIPLVSTLSSLVQLPRELAEKSIRCVFKGGIADCLPAEMVCEKMYLLIHL